MAFREKSAWVMMVVMIVTGGFYLATVAQDPGAPVLVALLPYVLMVVLASIVAQVALAIWSPSEASAPADERERMVADRASRWSSTVMEVGVVMAGAAYLALPNGNMLFHHAIFALIVAQIVNYAMQIALLRRSF